MDTLQQGKSSLPGILSIHQGVCYEHTGNDDDPYRPLLWLHFHIMNFETGANNADLIVS